TIRLHIETKASEESKNCRSWLLFDDLDRTELLAESWMVHPCSLELYTGSGEDLGLVNDDGGELMRIFKWRHPQHGPSVFGIVKGHALHDSRQLFKVLSLLQL